MFRRETRSIGKKGGFTIPVQIRRALGIYGKTQVDILPGQGEDELLIVKARPHCICCGKVGKTLVPISNSFSRFVCSECIQDLSESLEKGNTVQNEVTGLDVIDNYNCNLESIDKLKKENVDLERQIQEIGIANLGNNKTVVLNGRVSSTKVQLSYTVHNLTDAGYLTMIDYMNPYVRDAHLAPETVKKYEMSSQFKMAAVIIYSKDYFISSFSDELYSFVLKPSEIEDLETKWKIDSDEQNAKLLQKVRINGDTALITRLNKIAKFNYVKQIFPKVKSEKDLELLRDCLIVSSCVKIKK